MPTASEQLTDVLARLSDIDSTSLADAGRGSIRVLAGTLRPVRPGLRLLGTALTVEARDDLMPMLAALQQAGPGDVLVVAGSDEHAVAGELFGTEALRRGMAGIVIDGFCRDTKTLAQLDLPVYARGCVPSAPPARSADIVLQQPIVVGGVRVDPGDLVLGDDDGLVVGSVDQVTAALAGAEEIQRREVALQQAIAAGSSLFDHVDFEEHLANLRAGRPSGLHFSWVLPLLENLDYDIDAHLAAIRPAYRHKRDQMLATMSDVLPEGVSCTRAAGGLFTWLRFPVGFDATAFVADLLLPRANVAYVPGGTFFPNVQQPNHARLSFSGIADDRWVHGITQLGRPLTEHLGERRD